MCNIVIYQHELKAVARAMATKDVRYYLNGVMIETNGADYRLVATDGARLHIVAGACGSMPTQAVTQYILPDQIIKTIIKAKAPRSDKRPIVCLTLADGKVSAKLPDGTETVAALIEAEYPGWRRLVPVALGDQTPASYNPAYLVDAYDGLADYMERRIKSPEQAIHQRGEGVGVLAFGNFVALIMPMRGHHMRPCCEISPTIYQAMQSVDAIAVA